MRLIGADNRRAQLVTAPSRLCFIVTSALTATSFLPGYLRFLADRGWDVTLISSPGEGVGSLAAAEGVRHIAVSMERDPSPIRDLRSLLALIRALRNARPDVVVYATPKASLLGAIAARLCMVPGRVYEVWGLRLETLSGLTARIFAAVERLTMRLSTDVIANSASLARRIEFLGLSRRAEVLGAGSSHGVNVETFSPQVEVDDVPGVFEGLVVGFVGRMNPDKGIDCLAKALNIVEQRGTHVTGLFVGGHEGVGVGQVRQWLGSHVNAYFVGGVEDVRPYLRRMDVLVLPSLREGFPNVVLEAAAMSVPAIVSDATGCVDSVDPGRTGEVVAVGDVEGLAVALESMAFDPGKRLRMGAAARARVVESFDSREVWSAHSDRFRLAGPWAVNV